MVDAQSPLSDQVAAVVRAGGLDKFDPGYDIALAAMAVGYDRLTKAQKRLFDRVIAPALAEARFGVGEGGQ